MRYTKRMADALLERRIRHHPAVLLVGPRATGKTTTALRMAGSVIRLDQPAQAAVVDADPDAALRGLDEPILIDEWQTVPGVLSAVKRAVDSDPRPGRFLITGSVRGDIDAQTWPGTGRLLRLPMYGLTVNEIQGHIRGVPILDQLYEGGVESISTPDATIPDIYGYAELAVAGGFPEPVLRLPPAERAAWHDSYIDQLLTRDVESLRTSRDPQRLRQYLEAYALNTAGVVDQRTIYNTAGIAKASGEEYERLLLNLLIVERLPAWWTNRLKRLIRTPKRYIVDPAVALAALRQNHRGLMRDGAMLGRALDTFVVAQLRAMLPYCESRPRLYHLRQEQGRHEADVVVEYGGGRIIAFELKATSAPKSADARHLAWLRDELGDRFIGGVLLHTGPRVFHLESQIVAAPIATLWT